MFGTNLDVDMYNHDKLYKLPGRQHVFKAEDTDGKKISQNCGALMALALKLNCKVLITRNLSNGLVNGLTGTVAAMNDTNIQVKIDEDPNLKHSLQGKAYEVERYSFLVRNEQGEILAMLQLCIKHKEEPFLTLTSTALISGKQDKWVWQ